MSVFEREFRMSREKAAELLRDIADSIENEEDLSLEGGEWKIFQPFNAPIPVRIFSDEESFELGIKLQED